MAAPISGADPSSLEPQRPSVLVVDDNQANLTALEAVLSSLDLDVTKASSGEEALRQLLGRQFAVVLMDVQMPGLDGFQTTELIRQRDRTRHTPIIFVTAIFTDEESAHKAYSLGALDFITKPFDESVLRAKVNALVGHYRQAHVIEQQAAALRQKERQAEREQAARLAAEAASRAKDQFLAMLSHELRAPLNSILGWSSHLQKDGALPSSASRAVEAIARSARAQSKIIDDLLDASQVVAETLTIDPGVVDLRAVVQAAVASVTEPANEKQMRIELAIADGDYDTVGDARRLEQLIGHLLSNALKFSEPGGVVTLALTQSAAGFRLSVKDSGIGISEEFLPHVFERFRQSDGSRTRRHGGLGIGLTVARHLAEQHGGTLRASSAGIDRGAEFVLELPRRDSVGQAAAAPETIAPVPVGALALDGVRLLVVDDDSDARELMSAILEDAGATVVVAESASHAVAAFGAGRFDAVISDVGMPEEDGYSLLARLRALDASFAAIALSGYGSSEDLARSRAAGFAAHVVKPFETEQLIALITRLTKPATPA